jgi:hypothetical protein
MRQTRTRPLLLPPPPRAPNTRLDSIEASKTVAIGCDQLPIGAHGKGAPPSKNSRGVAPEAREKAPSPANPKAHRT